MAGTPAVPDMRLELVPLPVSDVDRARAFYERAGFGNLHDTQVTETMRVVQLTPPGSSCAIGPPRQVWRLSCLRTASEFTRSQGFIIDFLVHFRRHITAV